MMASPNAHIAGITLEKPIDLSSRQIHERLSPSALVALSVTQLQHDYTHRLMPARYSDDDASRLARLTSEPRHLHDLFQLEGATNERLLGEANLLPGVTVHELVFGIPNWHIVNAAFTHPRPEGSGFNGGGRRRWGWASSPHHAPAAGVFYFAAKFCAVTWE